nr:transposase [Campylobacter concisus]
MEYSGLNGENNNQSESFNARFRRLQYGQCHKLTLYLSNYANEIAYREDTRRLDNKAIMDDFYQDVWIIIQSQMNFAVTGKTITE